MGGAETLRLLLDTHIWLWSLLAPQHLTRAVASALEDETSELWLSPVSIWELLILVEKGRVVLESDPIDWINTVLAQITFREAVLNFEVALESRRIELPHQDPADRFLAATARVYGLTLVTADERLIGSRQIPILANK
jgi:PIN domain nuclease of toxin-antitoxin system